MIRNSNSWYKGNTINQITVVLIIIFRKKDDYYHFAEENYRLVGEQHGRVFRLGEPVRVRVRNAEPANRTIDFTYVEKETETE